MACAINWQLSEYSGCNQIYIHYPYANQIMDTELTPENLDFGNTAVHDRRLV